ncbi:DUF937 domain-containing protein [Xanthobacter sp. TB0139]|uniref:DUF937 domain-containing protein n=1 Tax=Xanthobacter sp. TB0139 TaxID=3459178 RepID=UPI0040399D2B
MPERAGDRREMTRRQAQGEVQMDQFVEMMRAAQGGKGMENFAQMCGLSAQQAQAATEAMAPAFNTALRQITQSPESMASLVNLMFTGPYAAFYNALPPASGTGPQGGLPQMRSGPAAQTSPSLLPAGFPGASATGQTPEAPPMSVAGMEALNAVFGSSEVSQAVANQVAASTGLNIAVVRQAMPTMASMLVGGLAKSLAASGSMQQMLAALLSRMPIGEGHNRPTPISSGNPWADAYMAFTTSMARAAPYQAPAMGAPAGMAAWPGASFYSAMPQGTGNLAGVNLAGSLPSTSGNPWLDIFTQSMFNPLQAATPKPVTPMAAMPAFYPPQQPAQAPTWQDVVSAMTNTMTQAGAAMAKGASAAASAAMEQVAAAQNAAIQSASEQHGAGPVAPSAQGGVSPSAHTPAQPVHPVAPPVPNAPSPKEAMPNPSALLQDYYNQMLARSLPVPGYPGSQTQKPFNPFEYWMELMAQAHQASLQAATRATTSAPSSKKKKKSD